MKKTRHRGLYRLPDGRFRLRVTAICQRTGKLREATRTMDHGASEEEALAALLAIKRELRHGRRERPKRKLSVNDYGEQWLERKARRVRPSVASNYERILGTHILPRLGSLLVNKVTRDDVERWVAWAERVPMKDGRPYARDTVLGWWRVVRALLRDAAAELNLGMDPTYRVQPPNPQAVYRRELRTLTATELEDLLANIKQYHPGRYPEVYVLAYTGIRAGELFALRWEDIEAATGRIRIRRSVWNGQLSETKTDDPRDVALPDKMAEVLREHRRRMFAAQHPGLKTGYVFPANNGEFRGPQSLHKPLRFAAKAAGIDVKVSAQVLRRTFNTLMIHAGVDRIVLRSQMGHCSEEMTRRYAGVDINAKQQAVGRLIQMTETG